LLSKSQEGELVINDSSDPSHTTPDTSLALASIPSTSSPLHHVAPDTSLTSVCTSALHITPDTSLALSGPSPALLGREGLHADTSLTNAPQGTLPTYDFFGCLPPNPQDDEEDLDLNRTILPMPPNYTPPSPLPPSSPLLSSSPSSHSDQLPSLPFSPLSSSPPSSHSDQLPSLPFSPLTAASIIGHDISFMDALNDPDFGFIHSYGYASDRMTPHSLTSPPRFRHLSSALTNAASHSHAPAAISAPTYPPTPVPDTPAPTSSPEGVISADPTGPTAVSGSPAPTSTPACPEGTTAIGVTSPVTGVKASKRKSTTTNLEKSEMVQVKRPKKRGAVVVSTENSQPTEEGRGKRQRFQSSRAAAANDIGTNK
jgi:hypothetical protein